jgi:hypothetical protein
LFINYSKDNIYIIIEEKSITPSFTSIVSKATIKKVNRLIQVVLRKKRTGEARTSSTTTSIFSTNPVECLYYKIFPFSVFFIT